MSAIVGNGPRSARRYGGPAARGREELHHARAGRGRGQDLGRREDARHGLEAELERRLDHLRDESGADDEPGARRGGRAHLLGVDDGADAYRPPFPCRALRLRRGRPACRSSPRPARSRRGRAPPSRPRRRRPRGSARSRPASQPRARSPQASADVIPGDVVMQACCHYSILVSESSLRRRPGRHRDRGHDRQGLAGPVLLPAAPAARARGRRRRARRRRADPDRGIAVRALRREPDRRPPGAERPRANRPRHPAQGQGHVRRRAEGVRVRRPVADEPPRGPQRPRRAAGDEGAAARGGARLAARRRDARAAGVGADRAARAAAVPARRAARRDDRVHAVLDLRSDPRARHERPLALRDLRAGAGPQAPPRLARDRGTRGERPRSPSTSACPKERPILAFSGVTYLDDGRPVEYFIGLHRGDRSRFETELFRPSGTDDLAGARAAHVAS